MTIAEDAFSNCNSLLSVKLATATSINTCFKDLPNLTEVIAPNAVDLAANCFDKCLTC